jgi:hypothetical protein
MRARRSPPFRSALLPAALTLVCAALLPACGGKSPAMDPAVGELQRDLRRGPALPLPTIPPACGDKYQSKVSDAQPLIATQQYRLAIDEYRAALKVSCEGIPNYELYVRIAALHCRKPDYTAGLRTLQDFQCMLEIDSGERACYVDSSRAAGLSDLCFETMCERYSFGSDLAPHADPEAGARAGREQPVELAPDRQARVERLRQELETVRGFCLALI